MKITSIASGSSGNSICVTNEKEGFLIDAGISKKRIEEGLKVADIAPENLKGILITHEHSDHIKGLGVFLRKYKTPVYATGKTIKYILSSSSVGKVDTDLFFEIGPDKEFKLGEFGIRPFRVSHDAVDPVAYRFSENDKAAAVVTDLGYYDDYIVDNLKGLDAVLLESNHDVNMLQTGPYPYHLKQRIWGNKGHLSNETAGRLLDTIAGERLKNVILGHLSNENNYPELAFEAVRNEVNAGIGQYCANDFNLVVARRDMPSDTIDV
ncbi:MAG: MBL fold metallo-hydrolase [Lachnospiraceae bacterium]|nr:MBL fold metallo-hydrolase [Lachnospiraceae bacterium]